MPCNMRKIQDGVAIVEKLNCNLWFNMYMHKTERLF